jgi:hypothetical protein
MQESFLADGSALVIYIPSCFIFLEPCKIPISFLALSHDTLLVPHYTLGILLFYLLPSWLCVCVCVCMCVCRDWDLNSGLHSCKAGTPLLESHLQSTQLVLN